MAANPSIMPPSSPPSSSRSATPVTDNSTCKANADNDGEPPTATTTPATITTRANTKAVRNMNEPKATLYVSNIDWSIRKSLLRQSLYALFSPHGTVLDIITFRANGLRGQAWVVFDSIASATTALRKESNDTTTASAADASSANGVFFGRTLHIQYAHQESDISAKKMGTFIPHHQRPPQKRQQQQLQQLQSNGMNHRGTTGVPPPLQHQQHQTTIDDVEHNNDSASDMDDDQEQGQDNSPLPPPSPKKIKIGTHSADASTISAPPSNILFAQHLPLECNEMMLSMLFHQYIGFQQVRIPRPTIAFIQFDSQPHATVAFQNLNGFMLTDQDSLVLSYSATAPTAPTAPTTATA